MRAPTSYGIGVRVPMHVARAMPMEAGGTKVDARARTRHLPQLIQGGVAAVAAAAGVGGLVGVAHRSADEEVAEEEGDVEPRTSGAGASRRRAAEERDARRRRRRRSARSGRRFSSPTQACWGFAVPSVSPSSLLPGHG